MPAVRSKSKSKSGVVMTLVSLAEPFLIASVNIPINIANVEDLAERARHLGVASDELRLDTSLSQVGTHSEIGDSCDHSDRSGDVMEDAVGTRLGERQASESEGRNKHHRADGLAKH